MSRGVKKGHIVSKKTREKISNSLKGRHISPETEFTSEKVSGKNNPMYGKPGTFLGRKHSKETKQKMSESQRGHPATPGSFKKGHKVPQEWRDKLSKTTNKGKSSIHKLLFHSLYQVWTRPILERDNFTCQKCGSKKNLEVHHDKETIAEIIDKFKDDSLTNKQIADRIVVYHLNNNISGITLCRKCHRMTDTYGGRNRSIIRHRESPGG